jgi:hypothetical protein
MFRWLGALRPQRSDSMEEPKINMPDQAYWDMVLQNISDIRVWLAEVERNATHARVHAEPEPIVKTTSVDEDVAAADSPTRVQKALEREFGIDRRTVYQRVEMLVEGFQLDRKTPHWREDLAFWKAMAARDGSGRTALARGMAALRAKREVAA